MQVIYTPADEPTSARTWDFDPTTVYADEAELIEDHWGNPWDHFVMHVRGGSMKAFRLLLWHLNRADHPRQYANLKDVPRFRTGDVKIRASAAELLDQKKLIDANPAALTDAERTMANDAFEREYAEALEREGKPVTPPPALADVPDSRPVPEIPPTSEPPVTFGGTTG